MAISKPIVQHFSMLSSLVFTLVFYFGLNPAPQKGIRQERGYAILLAMEPRFWSQWQDTLRRRGLTPLVLSLLEDGGIFRSLISQGMLAVTPFTSLSSDSWQAFADMLEDPAEAQSFAEHLRREDA